MNQGDRFTRLPYRDQIAVLVLFAVLAGLFMLTPWTGDDWRVYHGAGQRVLHREALYGTEVIRQNDEAYFYHNPPWVAVLAAPLSLLPAHAGWAMVLAGTLLAVLGLLNHWQPGAGAAKVVFAVLSPPTMYIFLHGQIDALVVALVMLPAQWWWLVAVTKPQVVIGLAAGIPRALWVRAAVLTAAVGLVSLVWFGWWPRDMLDQPTQFTDSSHNLWLGLWPFQVPLGVALLAVFWSKRDERLLIMGSPLLSPYAAVSSLIGPWVAALTYLRTWQAALVWVSWWGAVIYRAVQ